MGASIDKAGPVEGCAVYQDGKLVCRDATVVLPSVTYLTVEVKAGGTMEVPLPLTEAMELAITRPGVDADTAALGRPGSSDLEVRWAEVVVTPEGAVKEIGNKAFLRAAPKGIPGATIETGSAPEGEHTFAVSRYRLVTDGKERLLVDKLADKLSINGIDFASKFRSLL